MKHAAASKIGSKLHNPIKENWIDVKGEPLYEL
jgi:hypothetical protein